jgi:pilus assembly protein CpaF
MQIIVHNMITGERWSEQANKQEIRIGRPKPNSTENDVDIVLSSRYVSYHQATLKYSKNQWFLRHEGLNDTKINDQPMDVEVDQIIDAGDEIVVGDFSLTLVASDDTDNKASDLDSELIAQFEKKIHNILLERMDFRQESSTVDTNSDDTRSKIKSILDDILETELRAVGEEQLEIFTKAALYRDIAKVITVSGSKGLNNKNTSYDSSMKDLFERMIDSLHLSFDAKQIEAELKRLDEQYENLLIEYKLEIGTKKHYISHIFFNNRLLDLIFGLGPLQDLLDMDSVSEIMVVSRSQVFIETFGVIDDAKISFPSDEALFSIIERIVAPVGRRIDASSPLVDARLKDGSRVNVVIPPLAIKGPCITIRKFKKTPLELADLISFGALNDQMARFLIASVQSHKNIIVSGGTGSGKTTLLNCISSFISTKERVVTVEDTAELQLKQKHVVTLESKPANMEGEGEVSIRDLVKNALRMRPDRIVVGECRGVETLDMLQAMNTGHDGSMTTGHANSPDDMMLRLETMVLMGISMPVSAIRAQIAAAVNVVVQLNRLPGGARKVTHISEITGIDKSTGKMLTEDIYVFQANETGGVGSGRFLHTGYMPTFLNELIREDLVDLDNFF